MKFITPWLVTLIVCHGALLASIDAAVVVIANRTDEAIKFEINSANGRRLEFRLRPNESEPVPVTKAVNLRVLEAGAAMYELRPDAVYYFGRGPDGLKFEQIGFSTPITPDDPGPNPDVESLRADPPAMGCVKVKILIDDELFSRRNPERRLRERVAAASAVFERAARVRFDVVAVETWESIDRVSDLEALLYDFERKVAVAPGQLAIGFSTQASRSKKRMGGTRFPLHSHILVRERGRRALSEQAQLELLVHELGHYLGAVHSPEWSSAMRPKLGDGLAGSAGFPIGLDPINTMIVYLVGEELRAHKTRAIWDVRPDVKSRLRPIYRTLAKSLPKDPTAEAYRDALDLTAPPPETPRLATPLAKHVRHIVKAVTLAAENNVQRPDKRVAEKFGERYRLAGDELTELYVRQAASAAQEIPGDVRARALTIGLAVAMDSSSLLRDNPLTRVTWRSIELDREYSFRKAVLGKPTMRGRADLTQHFCVSAGLAALFGAHIAEAAGVWKEHTDGTFSRGDYSADLAGIAFYEHLRHSPDYLARLASDFLITDFVPLCREEDSHRSQPEGINSPSQNRELRAEILREIERLPGFVRQSRGNIASDHSGMD